MNGGDRPPLVVAQRGEVQDHSHSRPHASRAALCVLVILVALGKGAAYGSLLHHPAVVLTLCGMGGVASLIRGRPIRIALAGAVIVPVAISPGSIGVAIAMGVGAFVALVVLFVTIGTLLHLTDARTSERDRDVRRS